MLLLVDDQTPFWDSTIILPSFVFQVFTKTLHPPAVVGRFVFVPPIELQLNVPLLILTIDSNVKESSWLIKAFDGTVIYSEPEKPRATSELG